MEWIVIASAGILSGMAGSLGIGGGGILIVFLTIFLDIPQLKAQGINLLFFIPIAILSIIIYSKQKMLNFKIIIPTVIAGLLGVFIGVPLANQFGDSMLRKIFALLLIFLSLKELFLTSHKSLNTKNLDKNP